MDLRCADFINGPECPIHHCNLNKTSPNGSNNLARKDRLWWDLHVMRPLVHVSRLYLFKDRMIEPLDLESMFGYSLYISVNSADREINLRLGKGYSAENFEHHDTDWSTGYHVTP
jgi:hypothetical protein